MTREAILFSYDTRREKFDSLYDRNKFYRGLFGYRQTVRENGKVYRYEKKGLINKMPHIKVEDSVIILLEEDSPCLREYLERWSFRIQTDGPESSTLMWGILLISPFFSYL